MTKKLNWNIQYYIQIAEGGTVARNLIENFPPSGPNYLKPINQMKVSFARNEFLIEVHVRELLDLVMEQATKIDTGITIANLYDKIATQLGAFKSLGITSDTYSAMLFPLVESALLNELLRVYERYRTICAANTNANTLSEDGESVSGTHTNTNFLLLLLNLMKIEVESEEHITNYNHPAKECYHSQRKTESVGSRYVNAIY